VVTDAYEVGHGRLTGKVGGGLIPVKNLAGPDVDKAELQRYLASLVLSPAILLNHASLESRAIAPSTLRLFDSRGPAASVELDLSEQGCPHLSRQSPRIVGQQGIATEWSATAWDFRVEGMRVPRQLKTAWHLPGARVFPYFHSE
jgi:hypothetical protein